MKFKSQFLIPSLTHWIRWLLLALSTFLFAFTESDYFRQDFDFSSLLSRYETLAPSVDYTGKLGIEIEGYYTEKRNTDGSISLTPYSDLVDLSTQTLKDLGYPIVYHKALTGIEKAKSIGVFYSSPTQPPPKRLMFAPDHSIFHTPESTPVEIVSPVLENKKDVDTFFAIVRTMNKKMNFTAEPLNSGTHFHFDFKNPTPDEVLILTIVIEKILPELKELFSIHESRFAEYAQAYTTEDFKTLAEFVRTTSDISKTENLNIHRHRATNWQALGKHGTFEFRAFNSTNDPNLLTIQADLLQKIVKAVRLREPRLISLLKSPNLSLLNLKNITTSLNCLLGQAKAEHYVRTKTKMDITYSEKTKIQPQNGFLIYPRLSFNTWLNSQINSSPVLPLQPTSPQTLSFSQRFTESNHYTISNMTITTPTKHACKEFYK